MGFRSVKRYAEAWEEGRSLTSFYRKAPTASSQPNCWMDMSVIGGGPPANYYATSPLEAATLDPLKGVFAGDNMSPSRKFLTHWTQVSNNIACRGQLILQDYILYYPFVDLDDLSTQTMTNAVSLPRYTNGAGVEVMAVCQSPTAGGGSFVFEYVNQNGVTKTSPTQVCQAAGNVALIGNLISGPNNGTNAKHYLELAAGDSGVRQINSVTMLAANGGLMALVLVKPLVTAAIREASVESEVELLTMGKPSVRIYDGAFLSHIMFQPSGQISTISAGRLSFIWDEGT